MITPTKNMTPDDRKELRKQIGKHLQELRKAAGYGSAAAFAEVIGFNANTYTQYEQGITGFNYEQAWIMADALHCSMDALGGRKPPHAYAEPASATERALVDDFRRMDDTNRASLMDTARTFALASELKKEAMDDLWLWLETM